MQSSLRNMTSAKNQKDPISKDMVRKMLNLGPKPTLMQTRDALMAALSFSLLLRNEELRHLACNNINENDSGVTFLIVSSKTDVFRKGKKLFLAKQDGVFSVTKLLMTGGASTLAPRVSPFELMLSG